ncbi:MAG: efflux RND transporter periplasmic adaptor subunit [bacterium]|nr:efflux RND transporter periplasmic adaptor subunit [bacterium]
MKRGRNLLVALVLLGPLFSCSLDLPEKRASQKKRYFDQGERPVVKVMEVMTEEAPLIMKARARFVPAEQISVKAPGAVQVEKVLVEEGQQVALGENLVQFKEADLKLDLDFARAELREAETALADYNYMLQNKEKLLEEEKISEVIANGLDKKVAHYKAQSERAKLEVEQLDKDEEPATVLTAPFDGLVSKKEISDGATPKRGDVLLEIVKLDPIRIFFEIPQEFSDAITKDVPVTVHTNSGPRREYQAEIQMIGPEVNEEKQLIQIKAVLSNSGYFFKPGQLVDVSLVTDRRTKVFSIPKEAVWEEGGSSYVYRIEKDQLQQVSVDLGETNENQITVVRGLKEKDRVVVSNRSTLSDGQSVEIEVAGVL